MNLAPWSLKLKIVASAFHGTAISCTIFRLMYRWHMARFWWEDGCAGFALVLDILCMVCVWLEAPMTASVPPIDRITNWIVAITFPTVVWTCRMSILLSIVRVANPSQQPRRIALLVGCSFIIMWAGLIAQKIQICVEDKCQIGRVWLTFIHLCVPSAFLADALSDTFLVAMPIRLLRYTKLMYRQRILLYSIFSATLLITVVTILHCIVLFTTVSDGIIVIGHVKTGLSLVICNLLVIMTFVYRVFGGDQAFDLDATEEIVKFTTVDLSTGNLESSTGQEGTSTGTQTWLTQSIMTVTRSTGLSTNQSLPTTTRSADVEEKLGEGADSSEISCRSNPM